jgi:hypothetical protein
MQRSLKLADLSVPMPKKSKPSVKKKPSSAPLRSPVRNSAIPKSSAASKKPAVITQDLIAQRAYFIHISGTGGSETDNWHRAERELRSGR